MKILLIQPITSTARGLPAPPFGLLYVAAMIEKAGFEVKMLDRNIETNTLKEMKKYSPDVLGVSCITGPMILDGLFVTKKAKEFFDKKIITIWGGIHPSLLPEQTLKNKYIDLVIRGEGEYAIIELLNSIKNKTPLPEIKGIGYKDNGKIFLTEKRPLIENLDELPMPAWHLVRAKKYLKYETPIITSRGCPHRCAFCYNLKYNERRWRGMSPEKVLKEIGYLNSIRPIKRLKFYDDNFTANKKRFFSILDGLKNDYPMFIETRVEYIDQEFIKKIKRFSDPYIFIGIESGSPKMLEKMKKDITIPQIKKAFKLLNENKINTTASFMIGLPGETVKDVEMTFKLVDEINPTRFTSCLFTPYPGSECYEEAKKNYPKKIPESLEEWGEISSLETASFNLSEIDSNYLEKQDRKYWRKSIFNFIKRHRLKWLYIGFRNYIDYNLLKILRAFRP